nr:uncharacterized protein LOC125641839 [Caretta caretta]
MAWHQGLSNPIPEFQLTLEENAVPPGSTMAGRRRKRRSVPSQPVTWGAVKALVAAAQRRLAANQQPETPETLFVAILAQITANSVLIVCLMCLLFPVGVDSGAPPPLRARMTYNLWERLASIADVTHFCLFDFVAAEELLGMCLIPVCCHPEEIGNQMMLTAYANLSSQYSSMANWGPANYTLPSWAYFLLLLCAMYFLFVKALSRTTLAGSMSYTLSVRELMACKSKLMATMRWPSTNKQKRRGCSIHARFMHLATFRAHPECCVGAVHTRLLSRA